MEPEALTLTPTLTPTLTLALALALSQVVEWNVKLFEGMQHYYA